MESLDLTPFGFTPTQSAAYAALLRLGPTTGYAVAQAIGVARANAYAALEGLVGRSAAIRLEGRPARYRPVDPQALLAQLAEAQARSLEALGSQLESFRSQDTPVTRRVHGARPVASAVIPLIARAEREVKGVVSVALWRLTLPAWRRAAARARFELRIAGDLGPDETAGISVGRAAADAPTILLLDERAMLASHGEGESLTAVWSFDPLLVLVAKAAVRGMTAGA